MRKFIVLLITLLPALAFSQKMVNGFGVEAFMGSTYFSPTNDLKLNYNGEKYQLYMTGETNVYGGTAYLPFDMGIKRHRFIIALGFEYRTSKINLLSDKDIKAPGSITYLREDIRLNATTYSPLIQVLYRPHFYLGRMHMSASLGANIKYSLGSLEITNKDNTPIASYDKNLTDSEDGYIDFGENYPAQRLRDLSSFNFNIDPRFGLDFYIGNSLMISIFAIAPDISSAIKTKTFALEYGAGLTYLIKTNKITEAKILQQYKK